MLCRPTKEGGAKRTSSEAKYKLRKAKSLVNRRRRHHVAAVTSSFTEGEDKQVLRGAGVMHYGAAFIRKRVLMMQEGGDGGGLIMLMVRRGEGVRQRTRGLSCDAAEFS